MNIVKSLAGSDLSWYVLHTYPNCEKKIHNELRRRAISTYLPLKSEVRQWSDRKRKLQLPLFPNYVFVQPRAKEMWSLLNIERVLKYVTYNGKPAIVKDSEMEIIKKIIDQEPQLCHTPIVAGSAARITDGPLLGMEGVALNTANGSRFCIKLEILNQYISVNIPVTSIEKLNN